MHAASASPPAGCTLLFCCFETLHVFASKPCFGSCQFSTGCAEELPAKRQDASASAQVWLCDAVALESQSTPTDFARTQWLKACQNTQASVIQPYFWSFPPSLAFDGHGND